MNLKSSLINLACLLVSLSLALASAHAAQAAQGNTQSNASGIAPAVVTLLEQAGAVYHKLHSYQHTEMLTVNAESAGNPPVKRSAMLAMERPNRIAVKPESAGNKFGTVVSDGKRLIAYNPDTSEYLNRPAPAALKDLPDVSDLVHWTWFFMGTGLVEAMLKGDPLANTFVKRLFADASVGPIMEETGRKYQPVIIAAPGRAANGSITFVFDAQTHLLHETVVQTPQGRFTETLSDVKLDAPLPATAFQYSPPANAKLVYQSAEFDQDQEKATIARYEGKPAPDFTLKDISGKEVKLSEMKGKVVVIDFWAGWCGPCQEMMPTIQEIYYKLGNKGVQVLAVDTLDVKSDCDDFLKKHPQYTMPILLDWTSSETAKSVATNLYGVEGIPTTVIIDKEGIVRTYAIGVHEHEFYMNALKTLGVDIDAK